MALHPCCGGSLQTGTKIVAIVQILLSTIVLIFSVILLLLGIAAAAGSASIDVNSTSSSNWTVADRKLLTTHLELDNLHGNSSSGGDSGDTKTVLAVFGVFAIISAVIIIFSSAFSVIMAVILLQGAKQRSLRECRIWLIVRAVLMVIAVVSFISGFAHSSGGIEAAEGGHAASAIEIILNLYCMWVVYEFMNELREEESASMKRSMYTNKP